MSRINVATIGQPEFINLEPLEINPLMSKCTIKVLYLNENRNGTYISKDVAAEMAKTLRGAPIVGYYKEDKEDFRDHGDRIIIDDEGISFESMTKPYGFVSPDAEVWFQKFTETDDFGNEVEREYLVTTGFLWTGQYEEAQLLLNEDRPQSMELDSNSLDGHWAENFKNGLEFFIINDAVFSKLCILGEDIEPCFEGANITTSDVSTSFTLTQDFTKSLYNMMQELNFALKGGQSMENDKILDIETTVEEPIEEAIETSQENFSLEQDKVDETAVDKNENSTEASSYVKSDDEEEDKDDSSSKEETTDTDDNKEDEDDNKKYTLLQEQFNELQAKFTALETDYQALISFKENVEIEKKDALINSFYMLSNEDKKEVIEHKAEYSLDDIEAKLSIIYTKKQLAIESEQNKINDSIVTYSLVDQDAGTPDWVKAVCETQETL